MANRVQDSSRGGNNISGGEDSEEKEKKSVPRASATLVRELSSSWTGSDSESEPEKGTSHESGTVRIRRVSTRTLEQAHKALQHFSDPTTAATTAATTATATTRSSTNASFTGIEKSQAGKSPGAMRHSMPSFNDQGGKPNTPASPTRLPSGANRRRSSMSATTNPPSSAPSSPRRSSVNGSPRSTQTPRSRLPAPGTQRAEKVDVVDRNIDAALELARKIVTRKSGETRLQDFRSGLSQATAIAPSARGELLMALAKCLCSLPHSKGACLAELRELAADMAPDFRKAFLQQLLKQLISNRDSSRDDSSNEDKASDAEQFKKRHVYRVKRQQAVSELMRQDISDASLQRLGRLIGKGEFSGFDHGVIETVIIGLDDLDPGDHAKVLAIFPEIGIAYTDVLGALMHSPHMEEIGKLAKNTGLPLSARYLGTLTGDRGAMQKLLLILGKVALPAALHVFLANQIGELRRMAIPAPSLAVASRALLMEIVSLSNMSEAKRCQLIHAVSQIDADAVHTALKDSELNNEEDYWAHAHQVVADVIDISSCYELVDDNDNDTDVDLRSYAARARKLRTDDEAKAIVAQKKCTWDAPRLRPLMLEKTDGAQVKRAVFNVLSSNLPYAAKLALLKCETEPVGSSVEAYVKEEHYKAAVAEYKKKMNLVTIDNDLAYQVVVDDLEKYTAAYKKLTKKLNPDAIERIKDAGRTAMFEAKDSRLPAMHVAAMQGNSDLVRGYMETVTGFVSTLPADEIVTFLELSVGGQSLFHCAMKDGTAKVIDACMSVILGSELLEKHKIRLLEARRQPDNLGAFYLAMSCGRSEAAICFTEAVLKTEVLDDRRKVRLLQCAKPVPERKTGVDTRANKPLNQAATTARAEAEHRKHDRLVSDFDTKVERSGLSSDDRYKLQTT